MTRHRGPFVSLFALRGLFFVVTCNVGPLEVGPQLKNANFDRKFKFVATQVKETLTFASRAIHVWKSITKRPTQIIPEKYRNKKPIESRNSASIFRSIRQKYGPCLPASQEPFANPQHGPLCRSDTQPSIHFVCMCLVCVL